MSSQFSSGVSKVLDCIDFQDSGSVSGEGFETQENYMTRAIFEGIEPLTNSYVSLVV
jgi:hypothetical protein